MSAVDVTVPEQPIYLINFEDYLRPKKSHKTTTLQCFDKSDKPNTKFTNLKKTVKRLKLIRYLRTKRLQLSKSLERMTLPGFLSFLRARNDDGLCKPKTGFEIYCEMSSIHGFHIFVGAKTWQRVLWWLLICIAILLSLLVLIMSYGMSADTPTIRYIESMMQPMSNKPLPFPAITICGLNRISKRQLLLKAQEFDVAPQTLQQLPWLTSRKLGFINETLLNRLSQANNTWSQLLEQLAPQLCETQFLACKWQGQAQNCAELLATYWSYSEGRCCSFQQQSNNHSANKLMLHLATNIEDYGSTVTATTGFQLFIHDTHTVVNAATQRVLLPSGTETHLMLQPYDTHATSYIDSLGISKRRCYLPNERALFYFSIYSQDNCLAECHSESIFQKCACVAPHMPRRLDWPTCRLEQFKCLQQQSKN